MSNKITPYAFFPKKNSNRPDHVKNTKHCQLLDVDIETLDESMKWCSCDCCELMSTPRECVCCINVNESSTQYAQNWRTFVMNQIECYSRCKKIVDIVTNTMEIDAFILIDQLRLQEKAKYERRFYVDEYALADPQAKYRFACYRKITMLVHKTLGLGSRVELPSCIVKFIRDKYPSANGNYTGFENVEWDED